jgi:hypothetical protein
MIVVAITGARLDCGRSRKTLLRLRAFQEDLAAFQEDLTKALEVFRLADGALPVHPSTRNRSYAVYAPVLRALLPTRCRLAETRNGEKTKTSLP